MLKKGKDSVVRGAGAGGRWSEVDRGQACRPPEPRIGGLGGVEWHVMVEKSQSHVLHLLSTKPENLTPKLQQRPACPGPQDFR